MSTTTRTEYAIHWTDGETNVLGIEFDLYDARDELADLHRHAASDLPDAQLYQGASLVSRTVTTTTGPWCDDEEKSP